MWCACVRQLGVEILPTKPETALTMDQGGCFRVSHLKPAEAVAVAPTLQVFQSSMTHSASFFSVMGVRQHAAFPSVRVCVFVQFPVEITLFSI